MSYKNNISLPLVRPLQSLLCLLGCRAVLLVPALLVFQGVHGLHEDQQDPLSLERQGVRVLQLDPGRNESGHERAACGFKVSACFI